LIWSASPEKNAAGEPLDDIVFDVVVSTVEGPAAGTAGATRMRPAEIGSPCGPVPC